MAQNLNVWTETSRRRRSLCSPSLGSRRIFGFYLLLVNQIKKSVVQISKRATPSAGCRFGSCFATLGLQLDNQMSRWIKGLVMGQRRAERDSTVNMLHIMQSSEAGCEHQNPPVYRHTCTVDVYSQAQLLGEISNTRAVTGAADGNAGSRFDSWRSSSQWALRSSNHSRYPGWFAGIMAQSHKRHSLHDICLSNLQLNS